MDNIEHIIDLNTENRLVEITILIKIWKPHDILIYGKLTVIKGLFISKFTHTCTMLSLPNLTNITFERVETERMDFLWEGNPPKY